MTKKFSGRMFKRLIGILVLVVFVFAAAGFFISLYVEKSTSDRIVSMEEAAEFDADCILVLGAGVREDGTPSMMLNDRILTSIELYENSVSEKLLMSGDHGREEYDEVNTMKNIAVEAGIPSENVFMDHAGFSTYDSLYRARDVFCVNRVVIVTQEYHLNRALYIAEKLGIEAVGVPADRQEYRGQAIHNMREMLARDKAFIMCIFKPKPKFLGYEIPVSGNGNLTNDKEA